MIVPEIRAILAGGYASDRVMENYEAYGFKAGISTLYTTKVLEKVLDNLTRPVTS